MVLLAAIATLVCHWIPVHIQEFVQIPAGSFIMGCTKEDGPRNAKPAREISLDGFEIMVEEVNQAFWVEVMGYNPSSFRGDNLPVETVSWEMCIEFIEELNRLDNLYNYRLPSEAEWEYAARAGSESDYFWGECLCDSIVGLYCCSWPNSWGSTRETGAGGVNQFGLRNMSGNVWEWCQDNYVDTFHGAPGNGTAVEVPGSRIRSARGGAWVMDPEHCTSSFRIHLNQSFANSLCGFRLVRAPAAETVACSSD